MSTSLARIISFIFNPLILIVFIPFFLIYKTTADLGNALYWTVYTLIFLLALASFVIVGVRRKIFTDLDVSKGEQRPLLFLISIVFALVYLAGLAYFQGPYILFVITFGIILGIAVVSIINTHIKASIHVATITAMLLALAIGYGGKYLFLLLLIPLVGWARVASKRHTLAETFVGGMLGSLLSLSVYIAVKVFLNR